MRTKKPNDPMVPTNGKERLIHEAEGGVGGAIAGAAVGMVAGPPGIITGAVIGGVVGTLAGAVLDTEDARKASRTRTLDTEIGVSGGDLGSPNLEHPSARVGAYSAASAGGGTALADDEPAEGPIQAPES